MFPYGIQVAAVVQSNPGGELTPPTGPFTLAEISTALCPLHGRCRSACATRLVLPLVTPLSVFRTAHLTSSTSGKHKTIRLGTWRIQANVDVYNLFTTSQHSGDALRHLQRAGGGQPTQGNSTGAS